MPLVRRYGDGKAPFAFIQEIDAARPRNRHREYLRAA
jgi:hypothetical protein